MAEAQRTQSMDPPSIPAPLPYADRVSSMRTQSMGALRSRHSALPLHNPPLRNRARTGSTAADTPPPLPRKSSSRPSTANSREDITPWEFQSNHFDPMHASNDKPSPALSPLLKTKASSHMSKPPSIKSAQPSVRSLQPSTATGPVEEVTPWEAYPPIPEKNTKYHITTDAPLQSAPFSRPPPLTATGFVEDVTPWELAPPPQEKAASHLASVDETSTVVSYDSVIPHSPHSPLFPTAPRASDIALSLDAKNHRAQKTGRTEDVTPWELEPGPQITLQTIHSAKRTRSSLTLAQVEEVTPWELSPPPMPTETTVNEPPQNAGNSVKKKSSRAGRPSSSSGNGKSITDLGFIRRRRSTGAKSSKSQTGTSQSTPKNQVSVTSPSHPVPHDSRNVTSDNTPRHNHHEHRDHPNTSHFGIFGMQAATSLQHAKSPPMAPAMTRPSKSDPNYAMPASIFNYAYNVEHNFSTPDRIILQEIQQIQKAHDSMFVLKGKGYPQQGGGVTEGKVHHGISDKEAPYPRCYTDLSRDLETWENMLCHSICKAYTWHLFEEPPAKVLDIGCGNGLWSVYIAQIWPECHIWGIDMVPTQPDLKQLGMHDVASRVHYQHCNFLEGLPFPNEEFDYIHVKRVALGVPENKWDPFFEECARVLKPGGAVEIIEEDLFFPGKPKEMNEPEDLLELETEIPWETNDVNDDFPNALPSAHPLEPITPASIHSNRFTDSPTPITNQIPSIHMPTVPNSPKEQDPSRNVASSGHSPSPQPKTTSTDSDGLSKSKGHGPSLPTRSSAKPVLHVKTEEHSIFGTSSASLLPPMNDIPRKRMSASTGSSNGATRTRASSSEARVKARKKRRSARGSEPYLLKKYKAPNNPRDHTILETIYNEMLSSRFINSSPLSILTNYLEFHFVDVQTHPPLLYTFPPTALLHSESRYITDSEPEEESSDEYSSDDGGSHDAIRPKAPKPRIPKTVSPIDPGQRSQYRCVKGAPGLDIPNSKRFVDMNGLIQRQSPYISIDENRSYAFSPAAQSTFGTKIGEDGKPKPQKRNSRLPNKNFILDLRSLNMHLFLRAIEILGCSESMWEWVLQYQEQTRRNKAARHVPSVPVPGGPIRRVMSQTSLSSSANSSVSHDSVFNGIAEMTRDDFEILLSNFELDMQDQAALDYVLQERMTWKVLSSRRHWKRKAFDEACKKWDKWVTKQERRSRYLATRLRFSIYDTTSGASSQEQGNDLDTKNGTATPSSSDKPTTSPQHTLPVDHASVIPFSPSSLPPHQRLSRSMRVFVAWKKRDPTSLNQAVRSFNG